MVGSATTVNNQVVLTDEQRKAVDLCVSRLRAGVDMTTLFGPAGTGKSTLARFIAEGVGGMDSVAFVAPTGKAALVLRKKGLPAQTLHSLIYVPVGASAKELKRLQQLEAETADPNRKAALQERIDELIELLKSPKFVLKDKDELAGLSAVILDESSMVGEGLLNDLRSFDIPILALGDPAQLPPVKATTPLASPGFKPTVLLKTGHRFADESPVNYFATRVRLHGGWAVNEWRDGSGLNPVESFNLNDLQISRLLDYDQVICGKNQTRQWLNGKMREQLGLPADELDDNDRLVALRNDPEHGLINGEQYLVSELAGMIKEEDLVKIEGFVGARDVPLFAFAYAITCHKAQGSEWDNIVIFDQSQAFGREADRWLYTAITRAAESFVLLRHRRKTV